MPNSHNKRPANAASNVLTDSLIHPSNKLVDISTEHSQIIRVLAAPLPQPLDVEDSGERERMSVERQRQLAERERFIRRYQLAIRAFLGKKLGDSRKVDEVWDLFLEKVLLGGLKTYQPGRSFRVYLKTVLRNTCYEYGRKQKGEKAVVQMESGLGPAVDANDVLADQAFNLKLIETLFHRALEEIRNVDALYFTALKVTTEAIANDVKPPSSASLSSILSAESSTVISRENARQIKSRASKLFANQLIEEVRQLIESPNLDEVENALIDIGILKYCKKALSKMREKENGIGN